MNIEKLKISTEDKSTWGEGPWQQEPDILEWKEHGFHCMIKRAPTGALCGYVAVEKGHPIFGLNYYKSDFYIEDVLSGEAVSEALLQKQINEINVHGGLTYAGKWEEESDLYWFGFDCSHAWDFIPKYDEISELEKDTEWGAKKEYCNIAYVKASCNSLAEQISKIK